MVLSERQTTIARILGKGLVGAIPVVGPLAAEVIGELIPDQRVNRITGLLMKLEEKISGLDQVKLQERFRDPKFIDLLEDGFQQAARALSEERLEHIAALLKNSLTETELRSEQAKRLLGLLGELSDAELIILKSYDWRTHLDSEYHERHKDILTPPPQYIGAPTDSQDQNAIHDSYLQHLAQLGLLRRLFQRPKRGEFPEFDERTGTMKSTRTDITPLGRLLLRAIDRADEV